MESVMKRLILLSAICMALVLPSLSQDWIRTGTGVGGEKIRIAVPDFKSNAADAQAVALDKTFNAVLFNDLLQAGIFDMVSRSFYPLTVIGLPADVQADTWSAAPTKAAMLAFGNLAIDSGNLQVQGWLYDVKNAQNPQVLAKQYRESASDDNARLVAHRFADEIIFRLGGGIAGVAETKLYFVSTRSGSKEIWAMDYDGAAQHQITHLNSISLAPRVSPDNTRVAFSSYYKGGPNISMWSLDLGRLVAFPAFGGTESIAGMEFGWNAGGVLLVAHGRP